MGGRRAADWAPKRRPEQLDTPDAFGVGSFAPYYAAATSNWSATRESLNGPPSQHSSNDGCGTLYQPTQDGTGQTYNPFQPQYAFGLDDLNLESSPQHGPATSSAHPPPEDFGAFDFNAPLQPLNLTHPVSDQDAYTHTGSWSNDLPPHHVHPTPSGWSGPWKLDHTYHLQTPAYPQDAAHVAQPGPFDRQNFAGPSHVVDPYRAGPEFNRVSRQGMYATADGQCDIPCSENECDGTCDPKHLCTEPCKEGDACTGIPCDNPTCFDSAPENVHHGEHSIPPHDVAKASQHERYSHQMQRASTGEQIQAHAHGNPYMHTSSQSTNEDSIFTKDFDISPHTNSRPSSIRSMPMLIGSWHTPSTRRSSDSSLDLGQPLDLKSTPSPTKKPTNAGPKTCLWCDLDMPCGKVRENGNDLQSHIEHEHLHQLKGARSFVCTWYGCERHGAPFVEHSKLTRHVRTHTGYTIAHCKHCGKEFNNMSQLENHERTHTDDRPCACDVCNRTFSNPTSLRIHMRTHTGAKPLKCKYCDYTCGDSSNMSKHTKTHRPPEYQCDLCGKKMTRKGALKRHQDKVHNQPVQA